MGLNDHLKKSLDARCENVGGLTKIAKDESSSKYVSMHNGITETAG